MALLQDLIQQIDDPALRDRILQETNKLIKQKKFGLVFEEHLPECTPLYDIPIRVGSKVAQKTGYVADIYTVLKISGSEVLCDRRETHEQVTFRIDEIVALAEFGEPIYPTLKQLDYVENAPGSDLWHTLIEADNYHALQLLEYLYPEKVDCIYIDPPYNTGAKDWKYNNDYVDSSDAYRHSKWLSMMEKRLKLAKKLLNPKDSVLIVTIDEKEYLHLGCLLEELFPGANITMATDVINPRAGVARPRSFTRTQEYIYFIQIGESTVIPDICNESQTKHPIWFSLMRTGSNSSRQSRPNLFYPVWVKPDGQLFAVGDNIPVNVDRNTIIPPYPDLIPVWPLRPDGRENTWQLGRESLKNAFLDGTAKINLRGEHITINYLRSAEKKRIGNGQIICEGKDKNGALILRYNESIRKTKSPDSVWNKASHDAGIYGSSLIGNIFSDRRFSFPKSLYAVYDSLHYFVANKPNALIIDFFAGSGTTLHAVNLLNAKDGGHRRCIMVTNNEVSAEEAKKLTEQGYNPGDEEWSSLGIARHVTWPRTVCSINGCDINSNPLSGNYGCDVEQYAEIEGEVTEQETGKIMRGKVYKKSKIPVYPELTHLKMSDGFKANVSFFKLRFLDKTSVALGRQFKELLPVLWMKGGAVGKCPMMVDNILPSMLILSTNKMAILLDEIDYPEFDKQVALHPEIQTIFIVTDSEPAYNEMIHNYSDKDCYQLYRDYLDNFRINTGR